MSLGIFNQLFNLLEEECKQLDLEMAARDWRGLRRVHLLALHCCFKAAPHGKTRNEQQRNTLFTQLATYLSLTLPNPQQSLAVQQLRQEASAA